ncbi:MAG: type II toxin-antitoxin system HicA family toxin [Aggregatilineales bacterium]
MSKREKRLQKLRQNYKNASFEDLRLVLEDFGFELLRSSGSHHTFKITINDVSRQLVVPYRRPVKSIYVTQALALIDNVIAFQEEQAKDENDD